MKSTVQEVCRPQRESVACRVASSVMSGSHIQEALVLFRSECERIEE